MRAAILLATLALPLVGCVQGGRSADHAVAAVVTDEAKREEAARAANAGATSAQAMARVAEGPEDQKPLP